MFGQELSNDFAMSTLDNIIMSLTYDLPPIYIGDGSDGVNPPKTPTV